MPTVHVLYGLPGSGKTTYAKALARERSAVRFTLDEWMLTLFPDLAFGEAAYSDHLERLQLLIWDVSAAALASGVDVIFDWNFWSVDRRCWIVTRAESVDADVLVHCMPADVELAASRVALRNLSPGDHFHRLSRPDVEHMAALMEPPEPSEGLTLRFVDASD